MVVMNGLAITAGSKPRRFAKIGRRHPMIIAITTAATRVRHTDAATSTPTLSNNSNFTKFAAYSRAENLLKGDLAGT